MKLMTSILTAAMVTGGAWAQNPNIINNVQDKMNAVQQQKTDDSNAALGTGSPAAKQSSKPAAGAPAPAVKPAWIPGSSATKPASASTTKSASVAKPVAEAPSVASSTNKLERVNVVHHGDDIQIEIHSRESVSPKVSKMTSPDRLIVELPSTVIATTQNKIAVGSAGVKDVRIGMDGKTPPTTSVVVDLEQAHGYDMTPGPGNQLVLTLHAQAVAKNTPPPAVAKSSVPAPKQPTVVSNKPVVTPAVAAPKESKERKVVAISTSTTSASPKTAVAIAAPKTVAKPKASSVAAAAANSKAVANAANKKIAANTKITAAPPTPDGATSAKIAAEEKPTGAGKIAEAPKPPKPEEKKWAMNGKRDPFFSPVVQQNSGSGCSTGKKCLEIGQINLRGVVKAEAGFIAVVTNSADKAYFLHENDPVFNGYVVRITGDSVVFQETVQDKLGKPLTREVTKKITTPAV